MVRILILLCLMLVPLVDASAGDAKEKYLALLKIAKENPGQVDWQALRFAYSDTLEFDVFGRRTAEHRQKMVQAFSAGNFTDALAEAELVMDQDSTDIDAHRVAAEAYRQLGRNAQGDKEHAIAQALIGSIATGDGLTPSTAFAVISVAEEYEVFRAIGLGVTRQTLAKIDDHSFDLMSTVDLAGKTQDYYFLIDRVLAAEARMLKKSP